MKILLVDDDPVALEILKTSLAYAGHQTVEARNGEEAWAVLSRQPVQIIVSDWMMPKLDGLELCNRIRARRSRDYVYFVLLTARSDKENYHTAMGKGVDDFLAKPFRCDELLIRLRVAERILGFMSQVRELKNLLPICSYCKRIRDDRDYWHQIESYIHAQTGTDFTHSICPECYQEHIRPYLDEARRLSPAAA
ncbi:MAG: response regulator [Verrucomicrobia bacterium]|nr:response regulator [Verrucomicrobiota bacterium]